MDGDDLILPDQVDQGAVEPVQHPCDHQVIGLEPIEHRWSEGCTVARFGNMWLSSTA